MATGKAQKAGKRPQLKVVFDTSVLYSKEASDLLHNRAREVISGNSYHKDLEVKWYLPETVRHERQFQMISRGIELLAPVQRLEKLLGHNLNITEEIVRQRVETAVESQIKELGIEVLALDASKVDWQQVMLDAAYRNPPFEDGKDGTEKGFRDALIVEAFLQLVAGSPKSPQSCRVVLVSGDQLLQKAAADRIQSAPNVRFLESTDDLQSLISTLVAEVTVQFVDAIKAEVQRLFFDKDNSAGLFYSDKVQQKIREDYSGELNSRPSGATSRENNGWKIGPPLFVKKEGQRIFWASRIEVEAKAYRDTASYSNIVLQSPGNMLPPLIAVPQQSPSITFQEADPFSAFRSGDRGIMFGSMPFSATTAPTRTLVSSGKSIFEVVWSVQVTTKRRLRSPKIESFKHVETSWQ